MSSHRQNLQLYFLGMGSATLFLLLLLGKIAPTFDPFAFRPLSIFFFIYIAVIILGGITTFQLYRYYQEFRSPDFLLLSFIVYNTTVIFFIAQISIDFLSNIFVVDKAQMMMPFFGIVINYIQHFGWTAFMIYTIKIYGWENYTWEKFAIIPLIYLRVISFLFELERMVSVEKFFLIEFPTVGYLFIFPLFTDAGSFWTLYLFFVLLLPWLIPIYSYIRLQSQSFTSSMKSTRYLWVSYSVIFLIIRFTETFITGPTTASLRYNIWSSGLLLSTLVIAYTLIFYPESLLLTTEQLFRAKRLYQVVSNPQSTNLLGEYRARIAEYIHSLPKATKDELLVPPDT